MTKRSLFILSFILIVSIIVFFIAQIKGEERYFTPIELSDNNTIVNNSKPNFIDTIASVGLDAAGLKGIVLVIDDLSDVAKSNFDGTLEAHIKYFDGVFYLFMNDLDREKAISVISHEIIHINQYVSGDLIYQNGLVYWKGREYNLDEVQYDNRPWEDDAYSKESSLASRVNELLYQE